MTSAARSRPQGRRYRETRADRYERQAAALLETVGHLRAVVDAGIQREAELQAALSDSESRQACAIAALKDKDVMCGWQVADLRERIAELEGRNG